MTDGGVANFYSPDLSHIHHHGFGGFAEAAAPELLRIMRVGGVDEGLVVDLGCGSGIWARELLRAGYSVHGVDVSPAMVELARSVAPRAAFTLASLHDFDIPPCVAITALGEAFNYVIGGEPDLAALFRRAHAALRPGGLLIFDLVVGRADELPMRYHATNEGSDWTVDVDVEEDEESALLTRRIKTSRTVGGTPRETVEVHRVRTFPSESVTRWLEIAGFAAEVADSYGSLRLAPRRLSFVARS